ncbi:MAG TPA: hypothetical protein ENN65_03840 [Candidatus Hydrogenedentes bacterium]|nr:hypothetical protein [Candidatus Hydrogenedentota bacterium]
MDAVTAHLSEHYLYYIIGAAALLPVLYLTKRWSAPLVFYTLEIAVYLGLMHLVMWGLVGLTRWFAENSSMKALREDGKPIDAPDWGTPLLEFWQQEAYQPGWVYYVEIVAALLIIVLVWRYRPMRVQRRKDRRRAAAGKKKTDLSKGNVEIPDFAKRYGRR